MKILYFTATGNSLAVAKRFDAELLPIPQMARRQRYGIADDDAVGIVYPTYNAGLPYLVRDYLARCRIDAPYVFAIATYGNIPGGTLREAERALAANGNRADYYEALLMVDNYLPMFDVADQLAKAGEKRIEENLERIVAEVSARAVRPPRSGAAWRLVAAAMGATMRGSMRKSALSYTVADGCIGCGICARVCPAANARQEAKGKPAFGDECERCYACVHNCPKKAIHLKGERSGERFRNPEVTAAEIIAANDQGAHPA